jgi:hypothetical protein
VAQAAAAATNLRSRLLADGWEVSYFPVKLFR